MFAKCYSPLISVTIKTKCKMFIQAKILTWGMYVNAADFVEIAASAHWQETHWLVRLYSCLECSLSAPLHRSWRVHKSTAFVVLVGHELQPLSTSSPISRCCASFCMSQSVSSRSGCLCVFAGAHVTQDSSIFRCLGPPFVVSRLRLNQQSRSVRNIRISQRNLKEVKMTFLCEADWRKIVQSVVFFVVPVVVKSFSIKLLTQEYNEHRVINQSSSSLAGFLHSR